MLQITRLAVQDTISERGRHVGFVMSVVAPDRREFSVEIPEQVYSDLVSIWPIPAQDAGGATAPVRDQATYEDLQRRIEGMNLDEMQGILAELSGGHLVTDPEGPASEEEPVPLAENVADLFSIVSGDDDAEPDDAGEEHDEPEEGPPVGGRTLGQL